MGLMMCTVGLGTNSPLCRILNLFSRDIYVVDQILARVIQNVVRTLCTTTMIVAVIGYSFPLFVSKGIIT